ncbi:hypothetical protein [Myceligenerans cantabricum]
MTAVLGCIMLAGCVAADGDALYFGESTGVDCASRLPHGVATFGPFVKNDGDDPVELRSVGLANPDGATIVGSAVVKLKSGEEGIGSAYDWPPDPGSLPDNWSAPDDWKNRNPVSGYRLDPGEQVDLWVGIKAEVDHGSSDGLRVEYATENGDTHWQQARFKLGVSTGDGAFCDRLIDSGAPSPPS